MIGAGTLHASAAVLYAAPKVASADNNTDLDAESRAFLDGLCNGIDNVEVKASLLVAGQSLSAYLEQHPFIFRTFHIYLPPNLN